MSEEITQHTAASADSHIPVSTQAQEQQPQQTNELEMEVEKTAVDASITEGTQGTFNGQPNPYVNENTEAQPEDKSDRKITHYRKRSLRTGLGKRLGFNSVQEMQELREPEEPYDEHDHYNHGPYDQGYNNDYNRGYNHGSYERQYDRQYNERRSPRYYDSASFYSPAPPPSGGRRLIDIIDNGKYKSKSYRRSQAANNGSGNEKGRDNRNRVGKGRRNGGKKQRSKTETPKRSIEDLDKELEEYMKGN
ncbi:hypothetical protein ACO0QE_002999 [Hanseniaspora vineae]